MVGTSNHEAMVREQRARKDRTRERVLATLRTIEQEVDERGFYPANHGKINLVEILRRAGVGATTLRNPNHHETRDTVHNWLSQLKGRGPPSTKSTTRAVAREKIAWYEEQLKILAADALTWRLQRESLIQENQELRNQISQFSGERGKVVGLHGMSGQRD